MASVVKITACLEKISHFDPDERYMSVLDITNELAKGGKLDPMLERRVTTAILERLEKDTSNDVQAQAVKSLSTLTKMVSDAQVQEVAERLSQHLLTGRDDLRDVYGIGLKTLIADASSSQQGIIAQAMAPKLLTALGTGKKEIISEALQVATQLFTRSGSLLEPFHRPFLDAMMGLLKDSNTTVRKWSISTMSALAPAMGDATLEHHISSLLAGLDRKGGGKTSSLADPRTLIQTIGAVSRQVGYRLGRHLRRIVPLFLEWLGEPTESSPEKDEQRENCLQAFESFLLRSPKEVSDFVPRILDVTLVYLEYDPNYAYPEEEEEDSGESGDDGEEDDEWGMDDNDFGDDDDTSWKVRRAAAKVLAAAIVSRPQMLHDLYVRIAGPLVKQFREREETVRLEVLASAVELVKATGMGTRSRSDTDRVGDAYDVDSIIDLKGLGSAALSVSGGQDAVDEDVAMAGAGHGADVVVPPAPAHKPLLRLPSFTSDLLELVPDVIRACVKLLKGRGAGSVKTRTATLTLLRHLIAVLSGPTMDGAGVGALTPFLTTIIPALLSSLKDKAHAHSAAMRLEAIGTLHLLLVLFSANASELACYFDQIFPAVTVAGKDDWYRLVAAVLRVLTVMATLIRPSRPDNKHALTEGSVPAAAWNTYAKTIYDAVLPRLNAHDIDQEVKECAIEAAGALLAHVGDAASLAPHVPSVLTTLTERTRSETTRMPTLRALAYLVSSPLSNALAEPLLKLLPEVSVFLRQASRPLRQQTLTTLTAIVARHGASVSGDVLKSALVNAAATLDDSDLQIAQQGLSLATATVITAPTHARTALVDTVLPSAIVLASSPVLQGVTLSTLQHFFAKAVELEDSAASPFAFTKLSDAVIASVKERGTAVAAGGGGAALSAGLLRQSIAHAASVVATLCVHAKAKDSRPVIAGFLAQVTGGSAGSDDTVLALRCLGEVGRQVDVAEIDAAATTKVMSLFEHGLEDVKAAAAFALGGICVGGMSAGLPTLLSALTTSTASGERAYLLLSALREVLLRHAPATPHGPSFEAHVASVGPALLNPAVAGCGDDGVRNMAAECLGRLAAVAPAAIIPSILALAGDGHAAIRWTAVTSVRFGVASPDTHTTLAAEAKAGVPNVEAVLLLLADSDLSVRQAAIQTLNGVAHSAPTLIRNLVKKVSGTRFHTASTAAGGAGVTAPATTAVPTVGLKQPDIHEEGVLAALYFELQPRAELIREVNLGPFTIKQDDGLPLRKAAFAALDTILSAETLADRVGAEAIPLLCSGMRDDDDVKLICQALLVKLTTSTTWQALIVAELAPITAALQSALDKDAAAKEGAMSADLVRSTLRAIDAIAHNCPDAMGVPKFAELVERCERRDAALAAIMAQIRGESAKY